MKQDDIPEIEDRSEFRPFWSYLMFLKQSMPRYAHIVPEPPEWIDWHGEVDESPINGNILLWEARFRDGAVSKISEPPCHYHWKHARSSADIVAYRVLADISDHKNDPSWVMFEGDDCPIVGETGKWQALFENGLATPRYDLGNKNQARWGYLSAMGKIVAYRLFVENPVDNSTSGGTIG